MGSSYKKEIFNEHVQQGVLGWAQKVKLKKGFKKSNTTAESTSIAESAGPSAKIEMIKRTSGEGNDTTPLNEQRGKETSSASESIE
jgi:mlo protein